MRLLRPKETLLLQSASRKEEFRKYLLFNTWATRELRFVRILHPYFTKRDWLKLSKSLKPSPPLYLRMQILSHLTQWIFLLSSSPPHQNLAISRLHFARTHFESLKHDIEYKGIAWMTTFRKTSLPPTENNFSFQLWRCFHIWSSI